MKSDKVSVELLEELERWQRPFSPLTVYSQTVKAQAPEADTSKGEEKLPDTDSEFEAMYGDLPEKVQQQLKEVATLKQKETEWQKQLEAKDKEARIHQSRADQAVAKLQAHNLLDQGQQPKGMEADPMYQEILQELSSQGIEGDTLKQAAKYQFGMIQRAVKASSQNVQQFLQPTLNSLGNIEADRYFAMAASQDKNGYFQNPELSAYVRENMANLVRTGQEIGPDTPNFLLSMAIGEQVREGKFNANPQQQTQQPMNFSTRQQPMNTGAFSNGNVLQGQKQGPVPKDENHAKAINTVINMWRQGLPAKKGNR